MDPTSFLAGMCLASLIAVVILVIITAVQAGSGPLLAFDIGDRVRKVGGDYQYRGIVVAAFKKRSGSPRFVVENSDGMLFIFNEKGLEMDPR